MSREYDLVHRTTYRYTAPVTTSFGRLTTTPADRPGQTLESTVFEISPVPGDVAEEGPDHFGNRSVFFRISAPHTELVVTRRSRVLVDRTAPDPADLPSLPWEQVAAHASAPGTLGDVVDLAEASLPSTHVVPGPQVDAFAAPSFTPGRPLAEAVLDLNHRIRTELTYRSGSTTTRTTQVELLAQRAGVCQDFAQLMIAALRGRGIPARYVSGYIETRPAPGREKLRGADASHAWVSVWMPGAGWVDLDPTNDKLVDDGYVTVGWGRDFRDVAPLQGVIFTDGGSSRLTVQVDLVPAGTTPFV